MTKKDNLPYEETEYATCPKCKCITFNFMGHKVYRRPALCNKCDPESHINQVDRLANKFNSPKKKGEKKESDIIASVKRLAQFDKLIEEQKVVNRKDKK